MSQPPPRRRASQPPQRQQPIVPSLPPKQSKERKSSRSTKSTIASGGQVSDATTSSRRKRSFASSQIEQSAVTAIAKPLRTLQRCVLTRFAFIPFASLVLVLTTERGAAGPPQATTWVLFAIVLPLLVFTFLSAVELARAIGRVNAFDWIMIFLAVVPLCGLMTISRLLGSATEILEGRGYQVSLFGNVRRIKSLKLDGNALAFVRTCRIGIIAAMVLPLTIMLGGVLSTNDTMNSMPQRTPEEIASVAAYASRLMTLFVILPWLAGGIGGFVSTLLAGRTLRWSPIITGLSSVLASLPFVNVVVLFVLQSKIGTQLRQQ